MVKAVRDRFWERYSLGELNNKEWEALCDGCGQCCLVREVKEDGQMTVYSVACELLDIEAVRCKDYPNRQRKVPHCHKLTPKTVPLYDWLPSSCAYRRLYKGKSLPAWHPLLVGNRSKMREKGITVSHYAVPQKKVAKRQMRQHIIARSRLTGSRKA